jgi:hypothetical protein
VEEGANVHPGEAVENYENVCIYAALEGDM